MIRAINVAREAGVFDLLPCAFLRLCNLGLDHGFVEDKSIFLERADLRLFAIGRENIRVASELYIFDFIHPNCLSNACTNRSTCQANITRSADDFRVTLRQHLSMLDHSAEEIKSKAELCLACGLDCGKCSKQDLRYYGLYYLIFSVWELAGRS